MGKISELNESACMRSPLFINKEYLHNIESESKEDFIRQKKVEIEELLVKSAVNRKRTCEVPYHPLLDSFFEELMNGGLKIESRTLDKITLSWLT